MSQPNHPDRRPPDARGREMNTVLERNIGTLTQERARTRRDAGFQQRAADAVTAFTGSILFVYLHVVLFGLWAIINLGWIPGLAPWDETFVILATIASVEAIFLSTFVLISQNRMAAEADRRAELDLQINLLAEHEVTRLLEMVALIAERLEVSIPDPGGLEELQEDVHPKAVIDRIDGHSAGQ